MGPALAARSLGLVIWATLLGVCDAIWEVGYNEGGGKTDHNLGKAPCRRFVLISQQRSGTRFFIDKLKSHPEVGVDGELFFHHRNGSSYDWSKMRQYIDADMYHYCGSNSKRTVVGFKWMTNQGQDEEHEHALEYFKETNTKVIYLWRRNALRQHISNVANKLRESLAGQMAHPKDAQAVSMAAFKFELSYGKKLERQLEEIYAARERVTRYYAPLHEAATSIKLYYEDVVESSPKYKSTWVKVLRFLGLTHIELSKSETLAIHANKPILASIINAQQVQETVLSLCANTSWMRRDPACDELWEEKAPANL